MSKTQVTWIDKMGFDVELNGHHFTLDAGEGLGDDRGPRPKGLLLSALAGCTGMDVVSILKKMKVEDYKFNMDVSGELTEEHPKVYHTINFDFFFEGNDLPVDKIKKAVNLSEERYCGVAAMLRKGSKIVSTIKINNEVV